MTKFLVDENINQKALSHVPTEKKGFDVLYPEKGSYKGALDPSIWKIAAVEDRVIVTCDRDFAKFGLRPDQFPSGVLWLRPPRHAQKRMKELLSRFCAFLLRTYPEAPYDFRGRIYEVHEDRVLIVGSERVDTHSLE